MDSEKCGRKEPNIEDVWKQLEQTKALAQTIEKQVTVIRSVFVGKIPSVDITEQKQGIEPDSLIDRLLRKAQSMHRILLVATGDLSRIGVALCVPLPNERPITNAKPANDMDAIVGYGTGNNERGE